MMTDHRRQMHDNIEDGTLLIEDLSLDQLKSLRSDFDLDYSPAIEFFIKVSKEIIRRMDVPKKKKVNINKDFY